MNTEHPETDDLNEYLQQPQAEEFTALRLHLAGCAECRTQLGVLSSLQQHYPSLQITPVDAAQQQMIEDLVHSEVDAPVLQKIKNNPAELKAALHYVSHMAAMSEVIQPEAQLQSDFSLTGQQQKAPVANSLKSLLSRLFEYQSPVWIPASVSAALVLALVVMIVPLADKSDETLPHREIVQYQDNPLIHFRSQDALPGIGFFSKAEQQSRPYDGLNVNYIQRDVVRLSWPAVENVKQYKLRLQVVAQGRKNTLAEVDTALNQAEIKLNVLDINHRYEWTLSGLTGDGKTFITTGGFVINNR